MDKKRAALVASASLGFLVSAIILTKYRLNLKKQADDDQVRAVVETDREPAAKTSSTSAD